MKETKIMKAFEQYIKNFDMNKGNVKAMYFHSIKMMELCKDIAANLNIFNDEYPSITTLENNYYANYKNIGNYKIVYELTNTEKKQLQSAIDVQKHKLNSKYTCFDRTQKTK